MSIKKIVKFSKKKELHITKNKNCQNKRLLIASERKKHNYKLRDYQKERLKNEQLRKIHIRRVLEFQLLKKIMMKIHDVKSYLINLIY